MQIQPILGYFWAILGLYQSPGPPPLLDLGPLFLHILDPALANACQNENCDKFGAFSTSGVTEGPYLHSSLSLTSVSTVL